MKDRLQVLHLCSGNLYGGVETLLVALAQYRDLSRAMNPVFTVCFEGRLSEELRATGASVEDLGAVRVRKPFSIWRARKELQRYLSGVHVDVVVAHSSWTQAIFGPVVRAFRLPFVCWIHGTASGRHWLERWAWTVSPDFAICNSNFTAAHFSRIHRGVPKEVLYNIVPPPSSPLRAKERSALRRQFGASDDSVVVLQASRMESCKGHHLHLDALNLLHDDPRWICWIVGGAQRPSEERYVSDLMRQATRYKLQHRIRFLGSRSDVTQLIAACEIFCQPNTGPESFGIVFVEAMWAGVPVVTTAMGGGAEIISNSQCGFLAPSNSNALADCLRQLISNSGLRRQMGAKGRERAREMCAPEQQLPRLAHLLNRAVQQRSAA